MTPHVLGALGAAIFGLVATTAGVIADVAGSSDFGPWAQVGGIATAVGALSYVAKLLADGKLVAQPISDLVRQAGERQDRLERLVEQSHDREDSLRLLLLQRGQK